ncbi:MAG: molybdenum cofactor biosynthesis protein [Deltaproteobacteria bacterium]|nr:molybdenum cofactor biosynthesis protein [Deltaproteobacteria bacterium]
MNISEEIARMKREPEFSQNVGMILAHNGVVRAWSRQGRDQVTRLEVEPNHDKIETLRAEYEGKPGIYKILVEARSGVMEPGDDLLFIVVAGDIRENVKPVLAELLDRIKSEAVRKTEHTV